MSIKSKDLTQDIKLGSYIKRNHYFRLIKIKIEECYLLNDIIDIIKSRYKSCCHCPIFQIELSCLHHQMSALLAWHWPFFGCVKYKFTIHNALLLVKPAVCQRFQGVSFDRSCQIQSIVMETLLLMLYQTFGLVSLSERK